MIPPFKKDVSILFTYGEPDAASKKMQDAKICDIPFLNSAGVELGGRK